MNSPNWNSGQSSQQPAQKSVPKGKTTPSSQGLKSVSDWEGFNPGIGLIAGAIAGGIFFNHYNHWFPAISGGVLVGLIVGKFYKGLILLAIAVGIGWFIITKN